MIHDEREIEYNQRAEKNKHQRANSVTKHYGEE